MSRSQWEDDSEPQCHPRESGHPDLAARAGALDSRFRGNDTTLKDFILERRARPVARESLEENNRDLERLAKKLWRPPSFRPLPFRR